MRTVLRHRIVAVVGPPGAGTSAVVEQVVDRLLRDGHTTTRRIAPFDVRGWATTPDDAPTIAGQLLPTFGLAEPASGDLATMDAAAVRLRSCLADDGSVLVLDNVTGDEQIRWLTRTWTKRPNAQEDRPDAPATGPLLVIAYSTDEPTTTTTSGTGTGTGQLTDDGASVDLPALREEWVVRLDPLEPDDVDRLWTALLNPPDGDAWPWYLTDGPLIDSLHAACKGMPAAVHDLARELARPGTCLTSNRVVDGLGRSGDEDPPRERVWHLILHATTNHGGLSTRATRLGRALAELPVAELTVEAIEAVRAGVDQLPLPKVVRQTPASTPAGAAATGSAADEEVAGDPIQELGDACLLGQSPVGRYRMPREIRTAARETLLQPGSDLPDRVDPQDMREAALGSLLHRYADLADRWSVLLDSTAHASSAARWFRAEEPFLRALLSGGVLGRASTEELQPATDQTEEDATNADATALQAERRLLADTIDDIGRIADALDAWYARQQQIFGAEQVHLAVQDLASRATRNDLVLLARTRVAAARRCSGVLPEPEEQVQQEGKPDRGRRRLRPPRPGSLRGGRFASALQARRHHERALVLLARAERASRPADPELEKASAELQLAWARLPKHDVAGEVTTLLTMAVAYLRQGLAERATDRLDLAETKSHDSDDASGLAHVAELRGVASWMQGRSTVAVAQWQRAMAQYADLDDRHGEARCLQHLGSAVVVAPELAGLLVDESKPGTHETGAGADGWSGTRPGPLDELVAVRHGHAWLERSQLMRAGHPGPRAAETYLRRADAWIEGAREPAGSAGRTRSRPATDVPQDLPARRPRTNEPSPADSLLVAMRQWFRTHFS